MAIDGRTGGWTTCPRVGAKATWIGAGVYAGKATNFMLPKRGDINVANKNLWLPNEDLGTAKEISNGLF